MKTRLLLAALFLSGATRAVAQLSGQIDLAGGAGLGEWRQGLWSLAPTLDWNGAKVRVSGAGEYRSISGAGSGVAGWLAGSWFVPLSGAFQVELAGEGRGQRGSGIPAAGAWAVGPRLHYGRQDRGAWLGLMGGTDPHGATLRWEAGLWRSLGRLAVQLRGWQTAARDPGAAPADSGPPVPDTLAVSSASPRFRTFTDLGAWARWTSSRIELAVSSGVRLGLRQPGASPAPPGQDQGFRQQAPRTTSTAWWQAEAVYWISDRIGVAGVAGRHPPDRQLDAAAGSFIRVGVRASWQRRRPVPVVMDAPRRGAGLRIRRGTGRQVEFAVVAPAARQVEIMGDFSDWTAIGLVRRSDGIWRVRLDAEPGVHRICIRFDDGPWQAPEGLRQVRDEFGGASGEVLIEGGD
jgi:Carbohydrate-binding module 48 (Isoamylase N-terminal domain)